MIKPIASRATTIVALDLRVEHVTEAPWIYDPLGANPRYSKSLGSGRDLGEDNIIRYKEIYRLNT